MSKPLPTRVASDDCEVTIDGQACRPHEGEWVELHRGRTVGEVTAINRLQALQAELAAAEDPERQAELAGELDAVFGDLCSLLARRLVGWSWTDLTGRALPQPDGTAAQLAGLESAEVAWLVQATREIEATESEAA